MFLLPVVTASVWGVFKVDMEPPLNKKALIPVSGIVRLIIEIVVLLFALWCMISFNYLFAIGYLFLIVSHYLISYDRVIWLLRHRKV